MEYPLPTDAHGGVKIVSMATRGENMFGSPDTCENSEYWMAKSFPPSPLRIWRGLALPKDANENRASSFVTCILASS